MKGFVTIALTAILGIPLAADEAQKSPAKTSSDAADAGKATDAPVDSPMVAAAKRARKRAQKSAILVNDANLKQSGTNARVTTTTNQRPVDMPEQLPAPRPTPEMNAAAAADRARKAAAEKAEAARKSEEARRQRLAIAAARAEEGAYDEIDVDPAEAERELRHAQQPTAEKKPPQR